MGNLLIVEAKLLRRGWITANVGEIKGEWGMTRAIVDQKLSALLSAETRLARTLRTSPSFDDICAKIARPRMNITRLSMPGGGIVLALA